MRAVVNGQSTAAFFFFFFFNEIRTAPSSVSSVPCPKAMASMNPPKAAQIGMAWALRFNMQPGEEHPRLVAKIFLPEIAGNG